MQCDVMLCIASKKKVRERKEIRSIMDFVLSDTFLVVLDEVKTSELADWSCGDITWQRRMVSSGPGVSKSHMDCRSSCEKKTSYTQSGWLVSYQTLIPFKLISFVSFLNPTKTSKTKDSSNSQHGVQGKPMDPVATHGTFRPAT